MSKHEARINKSAYNKFLEEARLNLRNAQMDLPVANSEQYSKLDDLMWAIDELLGDQA